MNIFTAAIIAIATQIGAAEASEAARGPNWVVEATSSTCSLVQPPTAGGRMALEWTPGSNVSVLWLMDVPRRRARAAERNPVQIALRPGAIFPDVEIVGARTPWGRGYATMGLDADFLQTALAATALQITQGGQTLFEASLPDRPEMSAFRACSDTLLLRWGISPEQAMNLRNRARPLGGGPGSWLRASDYPMSARRRRATGRTTARLTIDADGSVSGCVPVASSGHSDLDAMTCRVLSGRGRFEPARDDQGRSISSMIIMKISWQLP